ncbi:MAG: Stk1 family PASTA domain-containing Ser/Thr kinase [Bacilli bacterium]|nr:Stk1 family PASTA domain-containing Ser/Thr kinase [Bacilli bacterium]
MITKGQKINDRYEIIRSIGEGGMANVYLGYDTILDRNVAIKVLRGDLSNDEKFVRRFQREALSASSLAHPNIVEMYDVGEDDGTYYIVMEYVDGKTLKQLLKKRGTLTLSEAIDIMSQLTDGMAHAHDSYIIHRDLKPQNIMIKDDGQIKITDFGIAMALNATQLTQTNSVMGSVHYLPPEQASGKGCTIKSDIYSMGIIFYELLSGSLPFRGDNAVEIALKHMKEPLPSLREENPSIPQSIENIIRRATAKNPKNRYESAREMHEDLLTALDDSRMNEEVYQYKYPEHESESKKTKSTEKLEEAAAKEDQKIEKEIIEDIKKKEEKEEVEEEKKMSKITKIIIIVLSVLFIVVLGIVLFLFFIYPSLTTTKAVTVPDCEGKKVSTCEKILQEAGFEVATKIEVQESSVVKKNLVVKTDPEAGRSIKQGTTIKIFKSIGEEIVEVEDYTGLSATTVKETLEKSGIIVSIKKKDPEDENKKYEDDEIIDQSLVKGTELKKGDSITLYISTNETKFPDFVAEGYTLDDVKAFCDTNELTCTYTEDETEYVQEGKITYQSRKADTVVAKGSNLTVKYAVKPKPKPSPSPSSSPSPSPSSASEEEKEDTE